MNTARLLFAAGWILCLRAPALTLQPSPSLEGLLEEPAGVTVVGSTGFSPSDPDDARFAAEDAAVSFFAWETSTLTMEVLGPRSLRLHHYIGGSNTGGYTLVRLDGRNVREFHYNSSPSTDVEVPAGLHFVDFIAYATPVALYKVAELKPGLPSLPQPNLSIPATGPVRLRLRAESDSPVTWSATGLPGDLTLDASGLLSGSNANFDTSGFSHSAWVTMTNAAGSHVEQLAFYTLVPLEGVSPDVPVAGRAGEQSQAGAFGVRWLGGHAVTGMPEIVRIDYGELDAPELVSLVQGPDTVWFRAAVNVEDAGPVVVNVDGVEVLRRHTGTMLHEEMSVFIPPGEHEVAWRLPTEGRLGMIRLESSAAPRFTGPLTIPLTPGEAFAHPFTAAARGPVTWSGAVLPDGVVLDAASGVLTGTLPAGDYVLNASASSGGRTNMVLIRLQVRDDVAAVLGNTGAPWLQPVPYNYFDWHTGPWTRNPGAAPGGSEALSVWAQTGLGERSRLETVVTGPDTLVCRYYGGEGMTLDAQLDGVSHRRPVDGTGWGNSVTVPIPPGRHVLALRAIKTGEYFGTSWLSLDRLLFASSGTPAVTLPPSFYVDGNPLRIPVPVAGGAATLTAVNLPPGLVVTGGDISGSAESFALHYSNITATRGGQSATTQVEWWWREISAWVESPGWHGFTNQSGSAAIDTAPDSWDGVDAVSLRVPRTGSRTATLVKRITGPDTLMLRRRSKDALQFRITMDGAPVHNELLRDAAWSQVSVPVSAGDHTVHLSALPADPGGYRYFGDEDVNLYPQLMLDDIRLGENGGPVISSAERELWVREGEASDFLPASTGIVRRWSIANLPAGFSFDASSGRISAQPVTVEPGTYQLGLTAENARGSHTIGITLIVVEPVAHGDSPQLYLQRRAWQLELPYYQRGVMSVDGADVHYPATSDGASITTVVQGPDTLHFWWRSVMGNTGSLRVIMDGQTVSGGIGNNDLTWRRVSIPIPAGRHLIELYADNYLAVDHITLASDGLPLPLVNEVMAVPAGAFSLPLTALPAAETWTASTFTISPAGVLSGAMKEGGATEVRVSATNARGTAHAVFTVRVMEAINEALDTTLPVNAPSFHWSAETPPPDIQPQPVDDEDYLSGTSGGDMEVEVPPGGGILSVWAYARETWLSAGYVWGAGSGITLSFYLPASAWRRLMIPLPEEGGRISFNHYQNGQPGPVLWLDRMELLRPGDPIIDVSPLPDARALQPYSAQLRLLSGTAARWAALSLPPGLTLDETTGVITGTLPAGSSGADYPVRITATAAGGKSTFALLMLSVESELEPVAGGQWFQQPNSRWLAADDGAGGSLLSLIPAPGTTWHREELRLTVQAPCFVTFRALLHHDGEFEPGFEVRADQLTEEAYYHRSESGGWERSVVAVPGSGAAFVYFTGSRYTCCGALQMDDVTVFPWHDDANGDGLTNGMACALARWPDAASAGDPPFLITPHPSTSDFHLACFGSAGGDPALFPTRDHAIRLQLEESTGLHIWQPAPTDEEAAGTFSKCWRIPAPAAPRTFHRVQAVPLVTGD